MTTKLKNYRINITDDAQPGDALVVGEDDGFVTCHMGTSASCDIGTSCGNVPVLDENGKIPSASIPSVVMKKEVYDQCCCNADAFNYENFYNTPEIPEVFDPVVTFTQGGVTKGSISLNQASPTVISLDAGGVTAGCAIDIYNSKVSVKYDGTTIGKNNCNEICVVDYDTIKQGATCGASAVQADDLATVAMTGNYCDLINKPEIPSAQIQSDWEQTNINLPDYIKNKPTIGNATITLQKNGTDVDTFTLNQTANKCLNLVLDKCDVGLSNVDNTSDADKPVSDATLCALACKQDNISDLNTIRSNACAGKTASETIANYGDIVTHNSCEYATATQGGKADTAVQPGDLCTVATSGKYCDLSGQPTIPTDNCQLANSCGYITNSVSNLTNYYLKCETYQKCEVDNLIANFGGFEVVSTLPSTNIKTNVIYLLGPIGTGPDKYEEWIYYNNTWTKIGETTTDLSNYAKCCDIPTDNCQLGNSCGYTTCTGTLVDSDLQPYAKSCDLKAIATSGKYCDLTGTPTLATVATSGCYNDLSGKPSLCAVATSGCYSDLSGTPSLATVATSGCYNDLTGIPTIPTDNCQLGNSCNYITKEVNNLDNYTPSSSLATVATSGAYCDLTGTPSLACVACSGSYEDLCCKPNLGVYQTTACMVCSLTGADDSHYPSAKTVADALSCAGAGDMLSTMYDPNGKCADAFDYSNFINTPNLATVATSGKYCDLTGTPTIPAALTAGCATSISSNKINVNYDGDTIKKNSGNCLYVDLSAGKGLELANNTISATNVYNIKQSDITITTDSTKGVAPYNTSYGYTNFTISANAGVKWVEGALYVFDITEDSVVSANRNSRVRIGDGAYIPVMDGLGNIADGRYGMNKGYQRVFVYRTAYQSGGALHFTYDSTYPLTTVAAIVSGTSTSAKTVSAQILNQGITCLAVVKNASSGQTITNTDTSNTTPLSLTSSATSGSSYIAFNGCGGYLGSFGVTSSKSPQFYNGTSHTLAYISNTAYGSGWNGVADTAPSQNAVYNKIESVVASIPTNNCQLANGCGYITNSDINTKTFTLSSASDTTNASAAAAYINGGNNAIVLYNGQDYVLSSKTSTQMVFKGQITSTANTSDTNLSQSTLTFTVSGNNVSAISATSTSLGSYLETNRNYGTAFTPTCAGHPATKKYVDDNINYICCSCASCYSSCCDNKTYIIYE